jgi:hypothetical protein
MLTAAERGKADAIKTRLRQRHEQIAADPNLSIQGKQTAREAEKQAAQQAHRDLLAASDARSARARDDAYGQAFGVQPGTDLTADQDNRDWAADPNLSPGEAARELAKADLRRNPVRPRAIAEHAFEMSQNADPGGHWAAVLDGYAQANPARQRAVAALRDAYGTGSLEERVRENLYRTPPS